MNTSEVLYRAADLIEERGWVKAVGWENGQGEPLCLEGGIMAASGLTNRDIYGARDPLSRWAACPAYRAVSDYLGTTDLLYLWNDQRNRTATEVIEVLRACAVIEAAKENADARESVTA